MPDTPTMSPTRPADRRTIAIEQVLRSRLQPNDLLLIMRALGDELPGRYLTVLRLLAITFVEVSLQLALAIAGKSLLEQVIQGERMNPWLIAASVSLVLTVLFASRARQSMQEQVALRWRERCAVRLATAMDGAALEDLSAVPMAALREILMTDAPFLTRFGIETLAQTFVLSLWILAAVVFLSLYAPPLLVVLATVLTVCLVTLLWGARRHLTLTSDRFRRLAALSQAARDVVEVDRIMLTRQFGLADRFRRGFVTAHQQFRRIAEIQGRLNASLRGLMGLLNTIAFLGFVIIGGQMIAAGQLDTGVLLAALFVVGQMLAALLQMGDLAGRAAEAATAGRRLGVYWDVQDTTGGIAQSGSATLADSSAVSTTADRMNANPAADTRQDETARELTDVQGLNVHGLGYSYPEAGPVFRDITLSVKQGQLTALTAATGVGKSTFARVATGLLPPDQGSVEVTVSGSPEPTRVDVTELPAGWVLYLGPAPILIQGSIRDNLFLDHDPNHTAPETHSPELATVHRLLSQQGQAIDWDDGVIDAAGGGLSSGQAQLVQVARALVRQPRIVVFDEASSALDMDTERQLQSALIDWCRQRVCLVISHRDCPWLQHADQWIKW